MRPIPGEVERAGYRIVQESLTNVRRHAGSEASVTVSLEYGPDGLTVRVDDTGAGGDPSTSDGNGIPGMRERAAALGGTLDAGPGPDGTGFRVEAYLPVAPTTTPTRGVSVIRVLLADDQALVRAGFRPCWTPRRTSRSSARRATARPRYGWRSRPAPT